MSTLPRRLQTMNRLRNLYVIVDFTTTNDHVTAAFNYAGDAEHCFMVRKGRLDSPFQLTFTMKEFDNLLV